LHLLIVYLFLSGLTSVMDYRKIVCEYGHVHAVRIVGPSSVAWCLDIA